MYLKIIFLFETHQLFDFTDILEILIWHLKNKVPVSIPGSYYFLNKYQNPNTGVYCGTMTTNTLALHVAPSFQKLLPFFSGQLAIHSNIKHSSSTTHSGGPPPSTLMGASLAPGQQCGSSSGRPPLNPHTASQSWLPSLCQDCMWFQTPMVGPAQEVLSGGLGYTPPTIASTLLSSEQNRLPENVFVGPSLAIPSPNPSTERLWTLCPANPNHSLPLAALFRVIQEHQARLGQEHGRGVRKPAPAVLRAHRVNAPPCADVNTALTLFTQPPCPPAPLLSSLACSLAKLHQRPDVGETRGAAWGGKPAPHLAAWAQTPEPGSSGSAPPAVCIPDVLHGENVQTPGPRVAKPHLCENSCVTDSPSTQPGTSCLCPRVVAGRPRPALGLWPSALPAGTRDV